MGVKRMPLRMLCDTQMLSKKLLHYLLSTSAYQNLPNKLNSKAMHGIFGFTGVMPIIIYYE